MGEDEQKQYRREFQIIMRILECIVVESRNGRCYQTRIEQFANIQAEMRRFYLDRLEKAEYVQRREGKWGKRDVTYYTITEKGLERFRIMQTMERELHPRTMDAQSMSI